jgi:glycosyltransferase involved in cell wall biosynthesis
MPDGRRDSIELVTIQPAESLANGLARIGPDCLMVVYRGFDDRLEMPVDIGVPTILVFDAAGLTGYSRRGRDQRLLAEKGLAQLRFLAPSVTLTIAPSEVAAEYLRGSCGFGRVSVVREGGSMRDVSGYADVFAPPAPAKEENLILRVEGPFDSTYSLAVVNTGLALALADLPDVTCALNVAPGDQVAPAGLSMLKNPRVAKLWKDANRSGRADAVIRNCYPPLPEDMDANGRYLYFFWEDSLIPRDWADRFNGHLTGVLAPTRHVERVLRDSGVVVPIAVVPCGLDAQAFAPDVLPTAIPSEAGFRFLHIGSGFPRKGVDVLLDAFFAEFSAKDDVCLVVKTFPNVHNDTDAYLASLRAEHPAGPEVVHIDQDVRDYQYYGLYRSADCFVSATRCEGFGLPMAEAMAAGIPVIVTDYSGHTDFCDDSTAFMVEATLVETRSHFRVPGAMWAEPSAQSLRGHMRYVFENRDGSEVGSRVSRARQRATELTWQNSAEAALAFIRSTLES